MIQALVRRPRIELTLIARWEDCWADDRNVGPAIIHRCTKVTGAIEDVIAYEWDMRTERCSLVLSGPRNTTPVGYRLS